LDVINVLPIIEFLRIERTVPNESGMEYKQFRKFAVRLDDNFDAWFIKSNRLSRGQRIFSPDLSWTITKAGLAV
jgi:hypothetical protein